MSFDQGVVSFVIRGVEPIEGNRVAIRDGPVFPCAFFIGDRTIQRIASRLRLTPAASTWPATP
jgi:hypothetical protein